MNLLETLSALGARLPRPAGTLARRVAGAYERAHPSVPRALPRLRPEHTAGARLLPDRAALVAALPRGGAIAELGVDEGDFSAALLATARPRVLHLVDTWGSERYGPDKRDAVRARFAAEGDRVRLHLGESVARVGDFADGSLDFVYVDTTHAYALTREELRAYAPKVAPGGMLGGHDYSMGNWGTGFRYGVMEAVQEFCVEAGWGFRYLTAEIGERQSFALMRLPELPAA